MNKLTTYTLLAASVLGVLATSPAMAKENGKNGNEGHAKFAVQNIKKINQSIKKTEKSLTQSIRKLDRREHGNSASSTPANIIAFRAAIKQAQLNFQTAFQTARTAYEAAIRAAKLQFLGTSTTATQHFVPVIVSATASPSSLNGTTSTLSVVADNGGQQGNLTYSWTIFSTPSGASAPIFSASGSKDTLVTFSKAGNYQFKITVTNDFSLSASVIVGINVNQVISPISGLPSTTTTLHVNSSTQFTVSATDQFGFSTTLFNWIIAEAPAGGSINPTGITVSYTASSTPGIFHVVASSQVDPTKRTTSTIEIVP